MLTRSIDLIKKTKVPFASQFDYSLAFVESGLEYLEDNGILGYVITSKIIQTTYAGELRQTLQNLEMLRIIDYSLYRISLFQDAVNYPLIIAIRKKKPEINHNVEITIHNTAGCYKTFTEPQSELPLYVSNFRSPWVMAPPTIMKTFRKMKTVGERLGDAEEIQRGIVTGTNDLYLVSSIKGMKGNLVEVEMAGGVIKNVECELLCPIVKGKDIDPFVFRSSEYLLFTHNSNGDVLCRPDQQEVLSTIVQEVKGLKPKDNIKLSASGNSLVYAASVNSSKLIDHLQISFAKLGFALRDIKPCAVARCWKVTKNGNMTTISIDGGRKSAKVFIADLEIPGFPEATSHFLHNLPRLVKRDDYKPGQVPWMIFRVSKKKLEAKVAWQENATEIEATVLPRAIEVTIGGRNYSRPLVPLRTVYFVTTDNPMRTIQLMLYFNSKLARSFMKLVCWKGQGGFFRHISASMGHIPLPDLSSLSEIISKKEAVSPMEDQLSATAEFGTEEQEIALKNIQNSLNLSAEEVTEFLKYGDWLNEFIDCSTVSEDEEDLIS